MPEARPPLEARLGFQNWLRDVYLTSINVGDPLLEQLKWSLTIPRHVIDRIANVPIRNTGFSTFVISKNLQPAGTQRRIREMLHEILLSLSGHPSPLLTSDTASTTSPLILSPPEKALLASVAHLTDLHCKLLHHTDEITSTHLSSICQAVALSIRSTHLARFQQKVLEVENGVLRKDSGTVGAYNIVPLTAIVGEFSDWTRRMEWFWEITQFMMGKGCTGAQIIDKLCDSAQTGYSDIEEVALHLVKVAETAWLKQASAWILYGRLPFSGRDDFFIHKGEDDDTQEYVIKPGLRPGFVSIAAAASVLFIGRSLNHIREKGVTSSNASLGLVSSHLRLLSSLSFPITASSLSGVITDIRLSLSRNALEKLLPLSRISEILSLFHEYFLLGRGEFAINLISEADEKIRSRWSRSDNLAYDKRDRLSEVVVKDGEVSAVLARTWAAMVSLKGSNDDEEQLELARDLIHLCIVRQSSSATPQTPPSSTTSHSPRSLVKTPFNNLLLSVSTQLTLEIPSPLDLFLTNYEVQTYSTINSYLLSIRRAHLRLSDLWKITSLRRHHPAPPASLYGSTVTGQATVHKLRDRATARGIKIRSVWATSSAALFLLGETETYFHGEIVKGAWSGFQRWLTGAPSRPASAVDKQPSEDVWAAAEMLPTSTAKSYIRPNHDPQTLSDAHRRYLDSLTQDLLLTNDSFTDPLYHLLQQIDHLVALVHRLHSIWQSLDLEADEGVVDAFSDFHKEEKDVEEQLTLITGRVKIAIEVLIQCLREIDQEKDDRYDGTLDAMFDETAYVPQRMSRVDRLLMKLDFGGWFESSKREGAVDDHDNSDDE